MGERHGAGTAISPAAAAVSSLRGLPATKRSTFSIRTGRAATALTAMRIDSIVSPEVFIAEAMFSSGKSHTLRSATFST